MIWNCMEFLSNSVKILYSKMKSHTVFTSWTQSVQFSRSVMSNSLQPHGLQHTWPPCLPGHEFTQTHVHWVGDTSQPSHPLTSPSPPAFNPSQYQGFFKWVSPSHQVAKVSASASVLPMNIKEWFLLEWTGLISLQSKGLSRVFSRTTVQKYQFFSAQPSLGSNSHIHTWLLEKS